MNTKNNQFNPTQSKRMKKRKKMAISLILLLGLIGFQSSLTAQCTDVVLNELVYDADDNDGMNPTGEWIELAGPAGTNVGCFIITDGDWVIVVPPGTTIPADGFLVFSDATGIGNNGNAADIDIDLSTCGCVDDNIVLTNGGEFVNMFDSTGAYLDGISWETPSSGNSPGGTVTIPPATTPAGCTTPTSVTTNAATPNFAAGSGNGESIGRDTDCAGTWTNSANFMNAGNSMGETNGSTAAVCAVSIDVAGAASACDTGADASDASDDVFEVLVTASVSNGSGSYNITDGTTTWGPFTNGTQGTAGNFAADGTTTVSLSIQDATDATCLMAIGSFGPVGSCSTTGPDPCAISDAGLATITCQDNGTPLDGSDDIISFELNPVNANPGASGTYQLIGLPGVLPTSGSYGAATTFTMYPGSANGTLTWNFFIQDTDEGVYCQTQETLGPLANCTTCDISIQSATATCQAGQSDYDLEICLTHTNAINSQQVTIEVDLDGDGMADVNSSEATINGMNMCYTLTGVGTADGTTGISVCVADASSAGSAAGELVIEAIMPDPASGEGCDEYIRILNNSCDAVDISGVTISDAVGLKHTFAAGTPMLSAGGTVTVLTGAFNEPSVGNFCSPGSAAGAWNNGGDTGSLGNLPAGFVSSPLSYSSNPGDDVEVLGNFTAIDCSATPIVCKATTSFDEPSCCVPPSFTAVAVCQNADTGVDAALGMYYIEIELTDLAGATSVSIADGTNSISANATGTYYMGPFAHSNAAAGTNGTTNILVTNQDNPSCTSNFDVVETFCGFDPGDDDDNLGDTTGDDQALHHSGFTCNCDDPLNPVTIMSQSTPGSFEAGGTTGLIQLYILADANDDIVAINNSGYFGPGSPMFMSGVYNVYAVNVSLADWNAGLSISLQAGANVMQVLDPNLGLCVSSDCFTTYDIFCDCCNPDAGVQATNSCTSICADDNTGLAEAGSFVDVMVDFADPSMSPDPDIYAYAFLIADAAGNIQTVLGATNYNSAVPADFTESVPLISNIGGMLPPGDYCIHGVNYLDSNLSNGAATSSSLNTLQAFIGQNVSDLAPFMYENNGAPTAASLAAPPSYSICGDLVVDNCTPFTILEPIALTARTQCYDENGQIADPGMWYVEVLTVEGGAGPYVFEDGMGTTLNITNTGSGTYYFGPYIEGLGDVVITATDNNSSNADCVNCEGDIELNEPQFPIVAAAGSNVCEGENIRLFDNGSGATTWLWTGPNGWTSIEQNPVIENGNADMHDGTYTVRGFTDDLCSNVSSVEIVVNPIPVIDVQPVHAAVCPGDDVIFTVDASVSNNSVLQYQWYYLDQTSGAPVAIVGETNSILTFPAGTNELTYFVIITANHNPDPDCAVTSDYVDLYIHAEALLSCNDNINLSLDENCSLDALNLDVFLEGAYNPLFFTWELIDNNGFPIALDDIDNYVGECVVFEVTDICTNNICWGNICIDDKLPPADVDCECETPYIIDENGDQVENPNCVLYCYDLWDLEILEADGGNNEVLPSIENNAPNDNCYDFADPFVQLNINYGNGCENLTTVTRTIIYDYPAPHGEIESISCTQTFIVKEIPIDDCGTTENGVWDEHVNIAEAIAHDGEHAFYKPQKEINLPCDFDDLSPESLAAYFDLDTPGRPSGKDRDDHENTPTIVEHNEGIPYAYPYVVVKGWRGRYHAKPIKTNLCSMYAVYEDQIVATCGDDCSKGGVKLARTWTILDWCTATTEIFVQNIVTRDEEPPFVEQGDITVSTGAWECLADVEMPRPEHLHDNCDPDPQYTVIGPAGIEVIDNVLIGMPKGIHPVIYQVEDCCGNITQITVKVVVADQAPPVAIANENLVLTLTTDQSGDGTATLYAADVDNFSFDNCTDVGFEIRRADGNTWCHAGNASFDDTGHPNDDEEDDDEGAFVKFCCEDTFELIDEDGIRYGMFDVILRVWDDGDMNSVYGTSGDNYNEIWATVRVEDKQHVIVQCPSNIEIECEDDWLNYDVVGKPETFSACNNFDCDPEPNDNFVKKNANSDPFFGEEIPAYEPSCRSGAIRRTWRCGDQTCTQWIIVRPKANTTLEIEWPEDTTISCLDDDSGKPEFLEDICELNAVGAVRDTFYFQEDACYTILNHWSVINWCDYDDQDPDLNEIPEAEDDGFVPGIYTHTQVVTLLDDEPPVIFAQDTSVTTNLDCLTEGTLFKASATDNGLCGSPWLKWDVKVDLWGDLSDDYHYSSYFPEPSPFYIAPTTGSGSFVSPTASGEEVCVLLPDGIPGLCGVDHKVTWTVSDGCGNETIRTSTLQIADHKPPTPYLLNLSTAVMENGQVELWAKDFNAGSFDNCAAEDDLFFTFSPITPPRVLDPNVGPYYDLDGLSTIGIYNEGQAEQFDFDSGGSSKIFDCDDLFAATEIGGILPLRVYVWDECLNYDFAIINLKLVDNTEACGGAERAMIAGRIMTEEGEGVMNVAVEAGSEQPLYPKQATTDETGSYAFENNPMNSDYILSGEKNDDWLNGVSTLDIVLIQKHILGLQNLNSAYKMIAADASNDNKVTAIDLLEIRKLILGITQEYPNNDSWRFVEESQNLDTLDPWPFGEYAYVSNLDQNMMTENFVGVKIGDVNASAKTNLLTNLNVDSRNEKSLELGFEDRFVQKDEVIDLSFVANAFTDISGFQFTLETGGMELLDGSRAALDFDLENLGFVNNKITVSWHSNEMQSIDDQDLFSIKLKANQAGVLSELLSINSSITYAEAYQGGQFDILKVSLQGDDDQAVYALSQNEPNPWVGETSISFSLAKAGETRLTVYDLAGKTLYSHKANYAAGKHVHVVKSAALSSAAGVLYYKMESGSFIETKKMILIE